MAGELGVPDLVGPRAKAARLIDAPEEIREAEAAAVEEDGLVNDLGALSHGPFGLVPAAGEAIRERGVFIALDFDGGEAPAEEVPEETLLVLDASLGNAVEDRVLTHGALEMAFERGPFQIR